MYSKLAFAVFFFGAIETNAQELNFQFGSKNYNNEFTTAKIVLDQNSGTATYSDTYCAWHEPATVKFNVDGASLSLERFPYKYCENRGKDMHAEISVQSFKSDSCYGDLKFVWIEDGLFGDRTEGTYPAKATGSSC